MMQIKKGDTAVFMSKRHKHNNFGKCLNGNVAR